VLAAPGRRDIPMKRADLHAMIYYFIHQHVLWDNADSGSYLIT
jgi:hypothetical protein